MLNRVCIKNVNPRNFYLILEACRQKDIPYYVPKDTDDECNEGDIVFSDGYSESMLTENRRTYIVIPYNASTEIIEKAIEKARLMLLGIENKKRAIIGIDIGERYYGIAVIVEHTLVHLGTTDRYGLLNLIEKYIQLGFNDILIKIGVTNSNFDEAISLSEEIRSKYNVKIGLVDENQTTDYDIKLRKRKVKKDENAAYNISLREPFIIYKNLSP